MFVSMSEPALLHLRVSAGVSSTAKVHDGVTTGAMRVVVSSDDGLFEPHLHLQPPLNNRVVGATTALPS